MKKQVLLFSCLAACLAVASCTGKKNGEPVLTRSGLNPQNYVTEVDGKQSALFTITNSRGMEVCMTSYGARIVSILVPDRKGEMQNVSFSLGNVKGYFPGGGADSFGASVGRYANRIGKASFQIDGTDYKLSVNDNGNTLHGGVKGWLAKVYDAEQLNDSTIAFSIVSPDGDQGFPGTVTAKVTYQLNADNAIDINYEAITDKKTVINMTNHAYFNLSGNPLVPILNHRLYINADSFTPTDDQLIPTGEIRPVEGTPMDFTVEKPIGQDISSDYEPIQFAGGYDHNWVLNTKGDDTMLAARLCSEESGITLEVYTNEPGIQIYTGNFLDGKVISKDGVPYQHRTGVCLETQHFPDSPNHPEWPSVILEPGQTYHSHCVYRFGVK